VSVKQRLTHFAGGVILRDLDLMYRKKRRDPEFVDIALCMIPGVHDHGEG